MAVDDQAGATGVGQGVDDREAVRMAGWRFMGDQNVASGNGQAVEIFRKNRVAMEQRQAAAPGLVRPQGRLERGAGGEGWRFGPVGRARPRIQTLGLKTPGQPGDARPPMMVTRRPISPGA